VERVGAMMGKKKKSMASIPDQNLLNIPLLNIPAPAWNSFVCLGSFVCFILFYFCCTGV
jgi:hypothetical protein